MKAAWYCANSGTLTHPGGEKTKNAWGLHDVLGNAHEWTNDVMKGLGYGTAPLVDPWGQQQILAPIEAVVLRGGGPISRGARCRSAGHFSGGRSNRGGAAPGLRLHPQHRPRPTPGAPDTSQPPDATRTAPPTGPPTEPMLVTARRPAAAKVSRHQRQSPPRPRAGRASRLIAPIAARPSTALAGDRRRAGASACTEPLRTPRDGAEHLRGGGNKASRAVRLRLRVLQGVHGQLVRRAATPGRRELQDPSEVARKPVPHGEPRRGVRLDELPL